MLKIPTPVPALVGRTLIDHEARTIRTMVCFRGQPPVTVVVPFITIPEPEPVPGHYL